MSSVTRSAPRCRLSPPHFNNLRTTTAASALAALLGAGCDNVEPVRPMLRDTLKDTALEDPANGAATVGLLPDSANIQGEWLGASQQEWYLGSVFLVVEIEGSLFFVQDPSWIGFDRGLVDVNYEVQSRFKTYVGTEQSLMWSGAVFYASEASNHVTEIAGQQIMSAIIMPDVEEWERAISTYVSTHGYLLQDARLRGVVFVAAVQSHVITLARYTEWEGDGDISTEVISVDGVSFLRRGDDDTQIVTRLRFLDISARFGLFQEANEVGEFIDFHRSFEEAMQDERVALLRDTVSR